MSFPVVHLVLEDRSDQRVKSGAAVKGSHQPVDHRLVDAGSGGDVRDDPIAILVAGLRLHARLHPSKKPAGVTPIRVI